MSRYLITGGAGFIGSHLAERLLGEGHEVVVLDDFSTGRRENLAGLDTGLQVIEACITSAEDLAAAMHRVQGLFHLAAMPSVARSLEAPLETHRINTTGTILVLDQARQLGLKVVYAGSSSVYGDHQAEHKSESLREDPLSPYAASKLAGELYCRAFARVYDLPIVITRFFNVFGPKQVPDSPYSGVIAAFCLALLRNQAPRIDGDGKQSRDFTYIDDVTRALSMAMQKDLPSAVTLNIACGESHDLCELLAILQDQSGCRLEPVHGPPRKGDVRHSQAEVSSANEILGFASEIGFREGLQRTFDWYRRNYS